MRNALHGEERAQFGPEISQFGWLGTQGFETKWVVLTAWRAERLETFACDQLLESVLVHCKYCSELETKKELRREIAVRSTRF